jgi:DNA mismatch endonuclease, patch repair protein
VAQRAARYNGLRPASPKASRSARGASAKRNTKPEIALRAALRAVGLRGYRIDVQTLPGRPDVVFPAAHVVVFCDGDFWHGRNLEDRLARLERGHNAPYWIAKISGNVARDRRHDKALSEQGWHVLRYWESEVNREPAAIAERVKRVVEMRLGPPKQARRKHLK